MADNRTREQVIEDLYAAMQARGITQQDLMDALERLPLVSDSEDDADG